MTKTAIRKVDLIVAPTGLQPGGYVPKAYADRTQALTPHLEIEVVRPPGSWRVRLVWPCPEPVRVVRDDPSLFPDAAALLSPQTPESPWVTMGAPGMGVDGVLWRADRDAPLAVRAEGLGSMVRSPAPDGWRSSASHDGRSWKLELTLPGWSTLDASLRVVAAVWRGSAKERAGLKSVTPGWLDVG